MESFIIIAQALPLRNKGLSASFLEFVSKVWYTFGKSVNVKGDQMPYVQL